MNKPKAVSLFTLLSITLLLPPRYTHACLSLTQERLGLVHLLGRLGEQSFPTALKVHSDSSSHLKARVPSRCIEGSLALCSLR